MESNLSPKNDVRDVLTTRIALFAQGAHIACRISHIFKMALFIKLALNQPVRESHIRMYAQCAEILKAMAFTYFRRRYRRAPPSVCSSDALCVVVLPRLSLLPA